MDMVQKFNHLKSEPKVGQRTSSAQAEEELAFKQRGTYQTSFILDV